MDYILLIPPLLLAIILHESAHGWVALKLGDPTARDLGRITLNPIPHIDLFGTILLPALLVLLNSSFLFGWAKPVPVDPTYFQNPKKGMLKVALAGPLTNLSLALFFGILFRILQYGGIHEGFLLLLKIIVIWGVVLNLVLAIFNLIPIPPLDGFKILKGLLSEKLAEGVAILERYGFLLILFLFIFGSPLLHLWVYPFVNLIAFLLTGESLATLLNMISLG